MDTKQLFLAGWSFCLTPLGTGLSELHKYRDFFSPVKLPHDWLIYDTERLYEDGCGWYCKQADFTEEELHAGPVILRFDGVYMDSTVYVNGQSAGDWKYGYSSFDIDMTEHLSVGTNEILVQVRYQAPNSRWYSGAGIYRNVWLKKCEKSYLPLDGTYVSIRAAEDDFVLEAETEVAGELAQDLICRYSLWRGGIQVQELGCHDVWQGKDLPGLDLEDNAFTPRASALVKCTAVVRHPLRWDIADPECYELRVELCRGKSEGGASHANEAQEQLMDVQRITVGFRTMKFDPEKGFFLNGRRLKVHGVCEHHDLGCLGAAFHEAAMARKLRILKGMGVNAIRTSHNMPAPEFMELADRMGFLVVDEAFDMWESPKTAYDYARFFREWAEKDVRSFIRRDRNHPCLMLWSIGNEIYDTHADARGQEITRRLVEYVREHDPKENAKITIGSNYMPWENARKCADIVKIAGYNYGEKYYDAHHREYPDWVIYGSETGSIVQSRGIYHFPLSQSILADEDEQCSALGNSATSWGAKSIEKCITDDRDAAYAFGQFLWTGFDYIGEPTPYHTKNSYFGQIDTAGFPKDAYYIFKAEWTDFHKEPMVHLFPYWDFNPGQIIDVRACTNAPYVELFVNGESRGRQRIDHAHGKKLLGDWQVPYEPGTIVAVAYDEEGREAARDSRRSFGDSRKIVLTADRQRMAADGKDLCFVTVETRDELDRPVENAVDYVNVTVEGAGRLLGLDNGDSTDWDSYKGSCRKLFSGKLLAVIGSLEQAGDIRVTATGRGLEQGTLFLRAESPQPDLPQPEILQADFLLTEDPYLQVRKVELTAPKGRLLLPEQQEVTVEARIYPKGAKTRLLWKAVNDGGVPVEFASVEELPAETAVDSGGFATYRARVTAKGDGAFRVRCMAAEKNTKTGRSKVTVISQLEFQAEGLGQAFLNPYGFISAGLYSDTYGEIGNGNEQGIATARDGVSGVIFSDVDFGEYGSDELTMPVFALSDETYPIEVWLGRPYEEGGRLVDTVVYQKHSLWNVYQEETWKLPERIRGVATIAFVLKAKVHIKGFSFRYLKKAYQKLYAAEADRIYGDSFRPEGKTVRDIGNNVTFLYDNMDFGEEGTREITVCGSTVLSANTIHVHFTDEAGETVNRILEFAGGGGPEQNFFIEPLRGKGSVELIFLPGSQFDLEYFQFKEGFQEGERKE